MIFSFYIFVWSIKLTLTHNDRTTFVWKLYCSHFNIYNYIYGVLEYQIISYILSHYSSYFIPYFINIVD